MFRFWRASSRAQTLSEKLDAMLSRRFNPDEPGAAIIATRNDETLYRAAYGMADVARGVKLDPGMTFRLGSLTKRFTAVGVMMLAEQGKLVIQQDIRDVLPNLPFRQGEVITVEHLLTHTSGVRDYTALKDFADKMARDISRDALIDRFKDTPLQFEPGSKFAYSNSNYVLLGALIERLSGQSYASFTWPHEYLSHSDYKTPPTKAMSVARREKRAATVTKSPPRR